MCYTIVYLCPCCKEPGGPTYHDPCYRQPCVGYVELEHLMQPGQFLNWSCATPGCGYSCQSLDRAYAEYMDLARAQRAGLMAPEAQRLDPAMLHQQPEANNCNTVAEAMVCPEPAAKNVEDAIMDDADTKYDEEMNQAGYAMGESSESADNQAQVTTRTTRTSRKTRVSHNPRPLPEFDDETLGEINCLMSKINAQPWKKTKNQPWKKTKNQPWLPAEDNLLLLLSRKKVSYAHMAEHFLIRHKEKGCETRRSILKNRHGR